MANNLRGACDGILQKVVTGKPRVPGAVAMITSRSANIYEGAAGERVLGGGKAMTTDTVFAHKRNQSKCRCWRPSYTRPQAACKNSPFAPNEQLARSASRSTICRKRNELWALSPETLPSFCS